MPTYVYHCPTCGDFELVQRMSEAADSTQCSCGLEARRNRQAEMASGTLDCMHREYDLYGEHGTRLYPASYLPNQAAKARREHPGTDFKEHNGALLPVIKDRAHKLRYLKEHGFVEY